MWGGSDALQSPSENPSVTGVPIHYSVRSPGKTCALAMAELEVPPSVNYVPKGGMGRRALVWEQTDRHVTAAP